jgi:uncharacterized protein with HEPN domain
MMSKGSLPTCVTNNFQRQENPKAEVRSIEIVGEASKRLPESLKAKNSELPRREIAGIPDKLIHAYFGMDTKTIWKTVKENIPQLKQTIKKMSKDQEK